MKMYEIKMIKVEEFFASRWPELREIILQAVGQPPVPPSTGIFANSLPPDPDDFGFYVSFRFAQSLQKLKGPNSWGLYLSKSAISRLADYLTTQGCPSSTAWDVAHEFVYRTVEIEYMADCAAVHFDHLEWLRGGNPALSGFVLHQFPELREIGVAFALSHIEKVYGTQSTEATLLRAGINPLMKLDPREKWEKQLAYFFVELYGTRANTHVLGSNPAFPIEDLIKTVAKLIGKKPPKRSPIGGALPVHYFP
jgi:hypothetical protein